MNSVTHMILDWTEEKMDELMFDEGEIKHPYAKAFALGALEGLIDGAVICGLYFIGASYVAKFKNRKK